MTKSRAPSIPTAALPASGAGDRLAAAVRVIRRRLGDQARIAVVLGSGFSPVAQSAPVLARLDYRAIPGFVSGQVAGHAGQLLRAEMASTPVLLLAGRAHFYEGYPLTAITFPIRALAELGVQTLLLTNAAGGIHPRLRPGQFLILRDHINLMGDNPLRGPVTAGRPRFLDLSDVYDRQGQTWLAHAVRRAGGVARRGVYVAVSGPSFETPAEIAAFRRLGADAVGMSTVPEAIVARHCGLRVAGLSLISNLAAGRSRRPLSHADVLACGDQSGPVAARAVHEFARLISGV